MENTRYTNVKLNLVLVLALKSMTKEVWLIIM